MKKRFDRSGEVRETDLLAALVVLWREKASVTVDFRRAGVTAGFDISDGEVVATFSADPRFENAAILVRAAKLDPATLDRLAVPEGSDRAMAAMQAGVLTRREWKWGEKIRAIEVLSDLLTWTDGRYLAEPDTRSVAGEFRLPIPRLLLELFLRSRDRALVDHQLGNPDTPLARSGDFDHEFSTFGLTADAESVVRLIDGQATARQIAAKAPADAFAVEKLLAALMTLGLLQPAGEAERSEPPPPAPAEPAEAGDAFPGLPELPEPDVALEPREELESSPLETADTFETGASEPGAGAAELSPSPATQWDTLAPGPPDPILERADEPPAERPGHRQGPILLGVLAVLAAAVAAVLYLRSGQSAGTSGAPAQRTVASAAPAAAAPTPEPTAAPAVTVPPRPTATRATAVPAARPAATARPSAPAEPERKAWLDRAQSDARRLASEPATRYAVQLLLACEVSTLGDAWKHDQPAGSLWLLATDHQGRTCLRVLWGRFATAEEARRAKDRVPAHFVTPSNRPAVVSVR